MKKILLGDTICAYCGGFGVLRNTHSKYRIRIQFPDGDWHFIDEMFDSREGAEWTAIDLSHGNSEVKFEIISPNGAIIEI